MKREDVERLISSLMEAEADPGVIFQYEDKYHLPAEAAAALRALLAERDAAFAAGQNDAFNRLAEAAGGLFSDADLAVLRELAGKPRP